MTTTIAALAASAVGGILALVFGILARSERKAGQRAQALLESSYTVIERLKGENHRLRSTMPTSDEFSDLARDELDSRGVSEVSRGTT